MKNLTASANNPSKAGQKASKTRLFGENSRYALYAVHTRFDFVEWIVSDSERMDELTGLPSIIRQTQSKEEAIKGLI